MKFQVGAFFALAALLALSTGFPSPSFNITCSPRFSGRAVAPLVTYHIKNPSPSFYCPSVEVKVEETGYLHREEPDCLPWEEWVLENGKPSFLPLGSHQFNRKLGPGHWVISVRAKQGKVEKVVYALVDVAGGN